MSLNQRILHELYFLVLKRYVVWNHSTLLMATLFLLSMYCKYTSCPAMGPRLSLSLNYGTGIQYPLYRQGIQYPLHRQKKSKRTEFGQNSVNILVPLIDRIFFFMLI